MDNKIIELLKNLICRTYVNYVNLWDIFINLSFTTETEYKAYEKLLFAEIIKIAIKKLYIIFWLI
ncbi:hypothetical protein BHC43_05530 [Snodgrassella alvi]|nr:hypothetical protein BHC43_05530 [Snodgrassella alvi]